MPDEHRGRRLPVRPGDSNREHLVPWVTHYSGARKRRGLTAIVDHKLRQIDIDSAFDDCGDRACFRCCCDEVVCVKTEPLPREEEVTRTTRARVQSDTLNDDVPRANLFPEEVG